jgi:conjugative transfer signal peptidase TraF
MRNVIITYLILPVTSLFLLALGCYKIQQHGYGLSYQVSPSMPKGWYWHYRSSTIMRHEWIIFTPNEPYLNSLLQYHLIPNDGWLLKEVVGVPGDHVCVQQNQLSVNGQRLAALNTKIVNNPSIPKQAFCGTLSSDEYFVLGRFHPRSYDSRYFGVIQRSKIMGIAKPLLLYDQSQSSKPNPSS